MGDNYTVLKIDELTRLGDMNNIERYYRYTIKTKGGTRLSVDVDEKDTKPEKVATILAQKAQDFDATLEL